MLQLLCYVQQLSAGCELVADIASAVQRSHLLLQSCTAQKGLLNRRSWLSSPHTRRSNLYLPSRGYLQSPSIMPPETQCSQLDSPYQRTLPASVERLLIYDCLCNHCTGGKSLSHYGSVYQQYKHMVHPHATHHNGHMNNWGWTCHPA